MCKEGFYIFDYIRVNDSQLFSAENKLVWDVFELGFEPISSTTPALVQNRVRRKSVFSWMMNWTKYL